jgi:signal transduction histidine kinase
MTKPLGEQERPTRVDADLKRRLETLPHMVGFLEGLFLYSPVPYAVFTAEGRCLLVNPAFEAMFGAVPPPEYSLFEDQFVVGTGFIESVRRALAGEPARAPTIWHDPKELRHVSVPDARRVAIACTLFPLARPGEAVTHLAVVYQDVTAELVARERAERERAAAEALAARLDEQQRRLRLLSEASGVLSESLDTPEAALQQLARLAVTHLADWCVVDVAREDGAFSRVAVAHADPRHASLAEALRQHAPGASGQHLSTQTFRGGRSLLLPQVDDASLQAFARNAPHLEVIRAMGLRSLLSVPLVARGRTLGVLTLGAVEASAPFGPAHLETAEDLAHRAALALDNARLYRQAQTAVRLRDEFLSVASHELKTPLTLLSLKLQGFARFASAPAELQQQRLLRDCELMHRQVKRLSELVNDLLDVSRISTGQLTLELEPVDLSELVREVVTRFEPEAERVGCWVSVTAPASAPGLWDRRRLDQVVSNLLSNALKYGAGKPVHVRVALEGTQARLRVEDEGIGIAPEAMERIFGLYERAVSERHYGGLGLGLYVTRQIIERLGGRVGVESAPGHGAAFTVELPLRPPSAP